MSATEPRRPSSAELVAQVASAALTRQASPPEHSVTLGRNARGVVQIEITTRGTDLAVVHAEAEEAFDMLCERYPYPATPDTNGGT